MEPLLAALAAFLVAITAWLRQTPKDHSEQLNRIEETVTLIQSEGLETRRQVNTVQKALVEEATLMNDHFKADDRRFQELQESINAKPRTQRAVARKPKLGAQPA